MHFVDALFFLQVEHCKEAYESELSRKHSPAGERVTSVDLR